MSIFELTPVRTFAVLLDVAGRFPAKDGKSPIQHIKSSLVKRLGVLEDDDLLYVYRKDGDLAFPGQIAESVAVVNDWHHVQTSIPTAFEECVFLLGACDGAVRNLIYITDNYKSTNDGLIQSCLEWAAAKRIECRYLVYGIGKGYSKTLASMGEVSANYNFRHVEDYTDFDNYFSEDMKNL